MTAWLLDVHYFPAFTHKIDIEIGGRSRSRADICRFDFVPTLSTPAR